MLQLLAANGDLYGLQLVAASGGRLKRGTVYVTLGRMEDKGFVTSAPGETPQSGGLPRRLYTATPLGRRMLTVWTSGANHLVPEFAS